MCQQGILTEGWLDAILVAISLALGECYITVGRDTRVIQETHQEIANVNFLYDDIVHVIPNTIDSCTYSATARCCGYVLERMFTKFSEITQCNSHYAVQGHSRSTILAPIQSSYTTSY